VGNKFLDFVSDHFVSKFFPNVSFDYELEGANKFISIVMPGGGPNIVLNHSSNNDLLFGLAVDDWDTHLRPVFGFGRLQFFFDVKRQNNEQLYR